MRLSPPARRAAAAAAPAAAARPASLRSAVWANPVVSPTTTRMPAPRSRPETTSSTRPSSRIADDDRLSSAKISAKSAPVRIATERVRFTRSAWSMNEYCNAMASQGADAGAGLAEGSRTSSEARTVQSANRLHWWGEVIIIGLFYGVYTLIRNQFGSELGSSVKQAAIDNAYDMIALERAVHLFGEKGIQDLFIGWDLFIQFWNIFYGFCHFAATIGVMALLFLRIPRATACNGRSWRSPRPWRWSASRTTR